MTAAEILVLCGPPSCDLSEEVPVRANTVTGFSRVIGTTTAKRWVYDRGWGRFPAVLRFNDGELQRIDYLSYRSGSR